MSRLREWHIGQYIADRKLCVGDKRKGAQVAIKKALILGNPNSIHCPELTAALISNGIEVGVVTRKIPEGNSTGVEPAGGAPVLTSSLWETPLHRRSYVFLEQHLQKIESEMISCDRDRYERAMQGHHFCRPRFTPAIVDGLSIARRVRSIRPDFVIGQEASTFGLATAWCRGFPRIIMPWGGDIFMYCDTTTMASRVVTYALRQADLIVTGAASSIPYIESRFGVDRAHIHFTGCWGLNREQFRHAPEEERRQICERFKIAPENLIVMNVRRFCPAWGSDVALEAFVRFAASEPDAHFVLLGGSGTEPYTETARQRISAEGLTHRFVILEGDQPLEVCAKLMAVTDIFVSLIQMRDMRSASVLQAAAAGGAPIIGDQAEYRCMESEGFRALFVDGEDVTSVVRALHEYAQQPELRRTVASANQGYLTRHEDGERQMRQFLQRVDQICESYRQEKRSKDCDRSIESYL